MEASVSLPSTPYSTEQQQQQQQQPNINVYPTVDSNSLVSDHDPIPDSTKHLITNKKRKKKGIFKDNNNNSSEVDSSICSWGSHRKGVRVGLKRRVAWRRDGGSGSSRSGGSGSGGGGGEMETIALPLGMSFAAVVAQVLERRDTTGERISSDQLSTICTSAVRESLANVFGNNFDNFLRNFEKSFGSTLRTLRYISESGVSNSCINYGHSQEPWPTNANQNRKIPEDAQQEFMNQENIVHGQLSSEMVNFQSEILKNQRLSTSIDDMDDCQSETEQTMPIDRGLALYEQTSQLVSVSSSRLGSVINQSVLSTMEKSVEEQTRANNLKKVELRLKKEGLDLKKMSMFLNYDSNNLKRSELAMGASMATFKAEKFKNQVEDMRHSELLKMCIDCLVFGLLIMLVSLSYGTYVFSYTRITEATSACAPFTQESKSWWIPKPVASFNTGIQLITCHVQVLSRMIFGVFMILIIAYLLVQRSAASKQTMPLTFIVLLLGLVCGSAGKFCVDTLGGSGYHWFIHWEILCLVHFLSNIWTSALFLVLYGPVPASLVKRNPVIPYWVRRFMFYIIVPLVLPLCCGLMPFAGPKEWKDHFIMLIVDLVSPTDELV